MAYLYLIMSRLLAFKRPVNLRVASLKRPQSYRRLSVDHCDCISEPVDKYQIYEFHLRSSALKPIKP
jgi:hypothetical protein